MAKRKKENKKGKRMQETRERNRVDEDEGEESQGDESAIHPRTRRFIWGILLLVGIVIFLLSIFRKAGPVGAAIDRYSDLIFGDIGRWVALALFTFAAFLVFAQSRFDHLSAKIFWLGVALNLVGAIGFVGLFSTKGKEPLSGALGTWLDMIPQSLFGAIASGVIFFGIFLVGLFLLLNFPGDQKQAERVSFTQSAESQPRVLEKEVPGFLRRSLFTPKITEAPETFATETAFSAKGPKTMAGQRYARPGLELLDEEAGHPQGGDIKAYANIIKRTLANFGIEVEMGEVRVGPTVTQYTLKPAEGVKLAKITTLSNDLALALAAHPLRIEAPIPGRSLVGIEIPNKATMLVRLKPLVSDERFQYAPSPLTFVLGRDVAGDPHFATLEKMPHLLIAGSTGTGKTIMLNSLILSLLYRNPPELMRFLLIDPKRVEFPIYNNIPHLLVPVVVDAQKTINALRWLVLEMERRFDVLAESRARDIAFYNKERGREEEPMPYIIVIIDELADLMAARGREVEAAVVRLAQMARAVGIHLVLATQRPSVEVITGLIKANITSRIAFQVASQVDSRTILDMAGADKLLGRGDMLFMSAETSKPRRMQGAYVSEKEVKRVTEFLRKSGSAAPEYGQDIFEPHPEVGTGGSSEAEFMGDSDPLYEDAKRLVIQAGKASASYLQRRLRVGYARAARLIDILEEKGVVGPGEGAKPREILMRGPGSEE